MKKSIFSIIVFLGLFPNLVIGQTKNNLSIVQFRFGTGIGQSNWKLNQIISENNATIAVQKDYSTKGTYIPIQADALLRLGLFKIGAGIGTDFNLLDSLVSGGDGTAIFRGKPSVSKYYGQLESDMIRLGNFTTAINIQAGSFQRFNFRETIVDNFFINTGLTLNLNNKNGLGFYIKPTIEYKQQTSTHNNLNKNAENVMKIKNIDSSISYYIAFGVTYGLF